ncbi:MAG: crotonase/enoyl-CoA hydratase family protein [Betaproteobacteria bacterium]|nr:crotonase/enoyl-CoA hydratase family protein [Betaproteobacteria bacterium]
MTETRISFERRDGVALMGLNRSAKRNAFDVDMYAQLAKALGDLQRDSTLRCGLLFGHGDHFTGGLELPQWLPFLRDGRMPPLPEGGLDPLRRPDQPCLEKPLVMAVQGWCLTIGMELMMAADVRIAADDTRFAMLEVKRGIYPIGGATVRFIQGVGWGNAMRYLLTGDELDAATALRLGFLQEVVPREQALERAFELARRIAQQAPLGVRATLLSGRQSQGATEAAVFAGLLAEMARLMATDDAAEGLRAFLERRDARFSGR